MGGFTTTPPHQTPLVSTHLRPTTTYWIIFVSLPQVVVLAGTSVDTNALQAQRTQRNYRDGNENIKCTVEMDDHEPTQALMVGDGHPTLIQMVGDGHPTLIQMVGDGHPTLIRSARAVVGYAPRAYHPRQDALHVDTPGGRWTPYVDSDGGRWPPSVESIGSCSCRVRTPCIPPPPRCPPRGYPWWAMATLH